MTKSFKCADVVKDCNWSGRASTVSSLMQKIIRHAENEHDIIMLTHSQKEKINASIRDDKII